MFLGDQNGDLDRQAYSAGENMAQDCQAYFLTKDIEKSCEYPSNETHPLLVS